MGVQGLWEILEPAGQSHSLTKIAVVDGFENNESGRRGYRIGIDASIWYQHATHSSTAGANPEIRLLFFRLAKLARLPWIVLFVFDGRERPKVKRGSRMGKSGSHNLTAKFKEMIKWFGMEWREARGEAEAELAYLNSQGILDAIITDDVDALVFGARTVIRNPSLALTGNRKNPATDASGKKCDQHAMVFNADRIANHPDLRLTRGGMILIALLSGGDYSKGVKNMGPKIAHGLAKCGFGDRLLTAYRANGDNANFRAFLATWRTELNTELHTNASGLLPRRSPSSTLGANWPDMELLEAYANPIVHAVPGEGLAGLELKDKGDMSLSRIAKFCEDHFDEWGHRSRILERFNSLMWEGAVCNVLRRAALEADEKERTKRIQEGKSGRIRGALQPSVADAVGTPASLVRKHLDPQKTADSREERLAAVFVNRGTPRASASTAHIPDTHPLIDSIVGTRTHLSTDKIPEYRVVIRCKQLEDLANKGIAGKHPEPSAAAASQNLPDEDGLYGTTGAKKSANKKAVDKSTKRIWVAASIMRQVHPELVQRFETEGPPKRTGRKRKAVAADDDEDEGTDEEALAINDGPSTPVRPQPAPRRSRPSATQRSQAPQNTAHNSIPAAPMATSPLFPSRRPRIMHNVGDINFEEPSNRNAFLFTFTDPCDPAMLVVEEEYASNDIPEFIAGSSGPAGFTAPFDSRAPTQTNYSASQTPARAPSPSEYDDYNPPLFSEAQEAVIDRALGLGGGGARRGRGGKTATSRRKNDTATSTATRRRNEAAPRTTAPAAASGSGSAATNAPTSNTPSSSQFTASQEATMDRALGLGPSNTGTSRKKNAKANAPRRRAAAESDALAVFGGGDYDDEPLPSRFTSEQEAMIDRALGLGGGAAQKRAKAPRKRAQAVVASEDRPEGSQPKRRRANPAAVQPVPSQMPNTSAQAPPPRWQPAPFPDLPTLDEPVRTSTSAARQAARPKQAPQSYADDIIDISDDEPSASSSSKRAPVCKSDTWAMPSSSQESRLEETFFFDFT